MRSLGSGSACRRLTRDACRPSRCDTYLLPGRSDGTASCQRTGLRLRQGRVSGYQAVFMPVSGSIPAVPGSWIVKVMTAPAVTSIAATFSVGRSPGLSE
jgi:hypothetical protein